MYYLIKKTLEECTQADCFANDTQYVAILTAAEWEQQEAAFDLGIALGSLVGGVLADMFGYTIMYFTVAIFPIAASVISAVVIKSETKEREGQ